MIKATGRTGDGTPLVVLGLSGENVTRLMADEPIHLNLADLGLPAIEVLIVGGRTEESIVTDLQNAGCHHQDNKEDAVISQDNEVQASPPNPVDVEKRRALQDRRIGEQRGVTLQIIRDFKIAEAAMRWRGVGVDVPEGHATSEPGHDWISTGDPCWCGSDNCAVCLICGEENHD